jgi:serine/threonine-protein kinase
MGFGTVWNNNPGVRSRLGCPTDVEKGVWAGEETFINGYMFYRQDAAYIYVMNNNGTWQGYNDTWTSAEPEWDTSIVAPPGYLQPKRGFGKVWRNNPSVRSGLSWATMEERGFGATVQAFTGGLMLWSNVRGVYVLYNDGTWQRF